MADLYFWQSRLKMVVLGGVVRGRGGVVVVIGSSSSSRVYSLWPRAKLAKKGISNPNRHVHNATAVAVISVVAKQQ